MFATLLLALASGALGDVGHDARLYATVPLRWGGADWGATAAVLGTTGLLTLADAPVRDWTQAHRPTSLATASKVVRQAGEGRWTVPALGILWGAGAAMGSSRESRVGREGLEAFAFSGAVSQLIKYGAGRRRPIGNDPYAWNASRDNQDGLSFPSGHAQAAWSVLTVVALEYRGTPAVTPLVFGLAGACALSRLYDDRHWASDVFLGATLGFASGWAVVHWNRHGTDSTASQAPALRISIPF